MSEPVLPPTDGARAKEPRAAAEKRWWLLTTAGALSRRHAIAATLFALSLGLGAAFACDELRTPHRVPRGVRFAGADLSHLDAERAAAIIEQRARERERRSLAIDVEGKRVVLGFQDLGLAVDVRATTARALEIDRDRGALLRFFAWVRSFARARELTPALSVNQAAIKLALDRIERETLTAPFAGGFRLQAGRIDPEPPRAGRRLERANARVRLASALVHDVRTVVLPSIVVTPAIDRRAVDGAVERARALASSAVVLADPDSNRELVLAAHELARSLRLLAPRDGTTEAELAVDPRELEAVIGSRRAALEAEPKPARFVIDAEDEVKIEPSEPDARLDFGLLADAVLSAAASPKKRGVLPLVRNNHPPLTTEAAVALGIRGLVSTFTTRHPCCERRVENIHRIADLMDGLVVAPGETVSVNAVVGPRTTKHGFVPAPTIEEGEMVETVGGGVSQFATTLFNALFYGGYAIVERQPHTYWFPRYPMGHEATLSHPKPDLVFKNDTERGLLIDTRYTNTNITVRIFGDNGGRKVKAEVSRRQNVVEPPVEIEPNPALAPDEERTREAGMVGWSVIVGRIITFADGTKKEERRKVTYRPKVRRVEVHPCRVPKGEKGYTGERCPEPEDSAELPDAG